MINILALTKYSYEGPSSRYRFYNYKLCFEKQNIEMTIKPLFSKSYFNASSLIMKLFVVLVAYLDRMMTVSKILIFHRKYDLILVEYELFPYLPAWFEYLLHKRDIKYIVDYDDAIFHKYDISKNKIIYMLFKNKIAKVMQYAQHVIVCNEYLESYAKQYNPHMLRLPTVVLLDKYKKEIETFKKEDDDIFVIGWIGSRTTSLYILEILPVIKRFVETYKNIRFDLVGFDRSLLSGDELEKNHLNIIDWREETEIKNILNFDVGIMPLHDDPWSRGKCGFKLVQYMSCKKPVIASPVGMNCSLVKDKENGFLANSPDEWFSAFETLYLDKKTRENMSVNNFHQIEKEYNHDTVCKKYVSLLRTMVKGSK